MESKATTGIVRMSARKVRLVADEVRGYVFPEAADTLKNMPQAAAGVILKTLKSAAANAKLMSPELDESDLYVKKIFVDAGTSWKRFIARSRGKGDRILRRTCRVTVVLSDE